MSNELFTTKATAKGGRDGHVKSEDGVIDLNIVMPTENSNETGTNPEQLSRLLIPLVSGALICCPSKRIKKSYGHNSRSQLFERGRERF